MMEVTAAVIWQGDKFLICQRPREKYCGLLWEFPGGKIEPGETTEECIIRECREELGVTLKVHGEFYDTVQEHPDRVVHLHFFSTEIASSELTPLEHNAVAWVTQAETAGYEFCPADAKMLREKKLKPQAKLSSCYRAYYRLKLNAELCEELDASIYSFPMKYHPIDNDAYFMNRDYIGVHWNRKFIRAVQAVLNSTKGCIGRGLDFFYEAFGKDEQRFWTIMWMPESFIIYRMKFKNNLAEEWENAFWSLPEEKLSAVKAIVSENKFTGMDLSQYDDEIQKILRYYLINRDMAKEMPI